MTKHSLFWLMDALYQLLHVGGTLMLSYSVFYIDRLFGEFSRYYVTVAPYAEYGFAGSYVAQVEQQWLRADVRLPTSGSGEPV